MEDNLKKYSIPGDLLNKACHTVETVWSNLPFFCRGITINNKLIQATMEILNSEPTKTLPQNCRNDIRERTPDGLDRRIKEYLNTDLRTANIITDVLERAGIVQSVQVPGASSRMIKGTRLNSNWFWYSNDKSPVTSKSSDPEGMANDSRLYESINIYTRSLERNPNDAGTWRTLSNTLKKIGKFGEANDALKKAEELEYGSRNRNTPATHNLTQDQSLTTKAIYCSELVKEKLKNNDLVGAYKYATDLKHYTFGDVNSMVVDLIMQIETRMKNQIYAVPIELVQLSEIIEHKIKVGLNK